MRIRFIQALSGPEIQCDVDTEHNWTDEGEARRLIDAGIAAPIETMAEEPEETADAPSARGKGRRR